MSAGSDGVPPLARAETKLSVGDLPLWQVYTLMGALALTLSLVCFTGLMGSDDLQYSRYARAIAEGTYAEIASSPDRRQHVVRYGVLLPVAAVYKVFGVSEWSTIAVPLAAATFSVVLLVEIGRRLFGLRAGILAGLLYASFPLYLILATVLVPEPISECLILGGVLCYLHARNRGGAMWLLGGLLMGVAYLAKETAIFIAGAFLLHALFERRWRGAAAFAIGVGIVGLVEHAYYALVWQDVAFRVRSTRPYNIKPTETFFAPIKRDLGYFLFKQYPRMVLVPHLKFGLHSLAGVLLGAAALSMVPPRRRYVLVLLWIIVPALYVNFGTWSLQRYAPLPRDERYIDFIFPPLMLLSGVALAGALAARAAVARAAIALVAVLMVSGVASGFAMRARIGSGPEMNVLREVLRATRATPGQTIYTADGRWHRALTVLDAGVLSPSPESATFILTTDVLGMPALAGSSTPAGVQK